MPELVYCDMRGVDVHESFCYGCKIPGEHCVHPAECPHAGTAQEKMI